MNFSDKPKTMIPKGVATFLPQGTRRRRAIEREILSSFNRWGYQEVIPPLFEYLDVFSLGGGEENIDSAYKFIDRATGRIMVLRPDITPQIARIASTLLAGQSRPLRLCYSANVFRHQEEHAGRERELFQVGGELIGPADAEADAEMISLTIEILQGLGLKDFRITLGQMAFTRGLLSRFMVSPPFFKKILHCVAKKEASQLESLLKQEAVNQKIRHEILSLLDLFGGEEVLARAAVLTDLPSCQAGLQRLKEVYDILKAAEYQDYLLFDLGEVRGFDYYTGTIFEVFLEGIGFELGGGGRYDHLLEKFGAASASTGFALYIDRIQVALENGSADGPFQAGVDVMLLHSSETQARAMAFACQLRAAGFCTIRKNVQDIEVIDSLLAEAAGQRISSVLLLQGKDEPSQRGESPLRVKWIALSTGVQQVLNQDDVLAALENEIRHRRLSLNAPLLSGTQTTI